MFSSLSSLPFHFLAALSPFSFPSSPPHPPSLLWYTCLVWVIAICPILPIYPWSLHAPPGCWWSIIKGPTDQQNVSPNHGKIALLSSPFTRNIEGHFPPTVKHEARCYGTGGEYLQPGACTMVRGKPIRLSNRCVVYNSSVFSRLFLPLPHIDSPVSTVPE